MSSPIHPPRVALPRTILPERSGWTGGLEAVPAGPGASLNRERMKTVSCIRPTWVRFRMAAALARSTRELRSTRGVCKNRGGHPLNETGVPGCFAGKGGISRIFPGYETSLEGRPSHTKGGSNAEQTKGSQGLEDFVMTRKFFILFTIALFVATASSFVLAEPSGLGRIHSDASLYHHGTWNNSSVDPSTANFGDEAWVYNKDTGRYEIHYGLADGGREHSANAPVRQVSTPPAAGRPMTLRGPGRSASMTPAPVPACPVWIPTARTRFPRPLR